jgi:hypothetical protein
VFVRNAFERRLAQAAIERYEHSADIASFACVSAAGTFYRAEKAAARKMGRGKPEETTSANGNTKGEKAPEAAHT